MAYSPIGANNGTGTGATGAAQNALDRADFAVKFSTDVLRYFQDTNIMKAKITNRSISEGKSESFPVVGNATAVDIANDGAELAVQNLKTTTREILIGDLTVSHSWITDLDKAMAHYDSQSAQSESIGRAIAKKVDQDVLVKLIAAGAIVDAATSLSAGLPVFDDDVFTDIVSGTLSTGAGVYAACVAAVTEESNKDTVGESEFVFRPSQYFMLLNNPAQTGLTWVNDPYAQSGKVPMLLGKKVSMSPHFPALAGSSIATTEVGGVLFSKEAVGCLELMSINTRVDYIPQRLSNLVVGKMAVGYGILNHGCAINISQT
jgi:hypothetical protein